MNRKRIQNRFLLRFGISVCMLCLLSLQFVLPAFAYAPSFSDVDPGHPYFESIEQAKERSLINGTGAGKFQPDNYLTAGQFATLLERTAQVNNPWSLVQDGAFQTGYTQIKTSTSVSHGWMAWCLTDALGYTPYDARLYNITDRYDACNSALLFLQQAGVASLSASRDTLITRGEAVDWILRMIYSKTRYTQPEPALITQFNIQEETPGQYAEALYDLYKIPSTILEDFQANGWQIMTGRTRIAQYEEQNAEKLWDKAANQPRKVLALTSYNDKTIYLASEDSLLHEMGHYVQYRNWCYRDKDWWFIFEQEAQKGKDIVGSYSVMDHKEYFAECFAYWLKHKNDQEALSAWQAVCPKTVHVFQTLDQNGWIDVVKN